MRRYHHIVLGLFLFGFQLVFSQNTITVSPSDVVVGNDFDMVVSLTNTNPIAALQFDVNFNKDALILQTGHTLTARATDHSLMVSNPSPGVVRVVLFSLNNTPITGNDGALLNLKFNALMLPSNYGLNVTGMVGVTNTGSSVPVTGTIKLVTFSPKIYLQGSSINQSTAGLMNDYLRSSGYLPTTSPYGDGKTVSSSVFNTGGSTGKIGRASCRVRV